MNKNKLIFVFAVLITLALVFSSMALADDGEMFRRNVSKTPDMETVKANMNHMSFYVPAQSQVPGADPLVGPITYYRADGTIYEEREYAKPLISVYVDGLPVEHEEEELYSIMTGPAWGKHDAFAAVSLDDGATWKNINLSRSADLSSFTLPDGNPYPGDAYQMTFTIAGDKVLVGWISKYCDGGSPMYTFTDAEVDALQLAFGLPDLYVRDIWGVAGAQKSVDYEAQDFPEVGVIPYSCVWSSRGQLVEVDAEGNPLVGGGYYGIVWTKAERLTSGKRDANRLEMNANPAAGFMMTWQEDPDGLRPGQGLGPGEGWSGAVVNQQTDLWYSFISIEDFNLVDDDADYDTGIVPVAIQDYTLTDQMPKVAVPMAMPIRLTDNKMCKQAASDPYCYVDFNTDEVDGVVNAYANTILPDINWDDPTIVKSSITQSSASTFCSVIVPWDPPGDASNIDLCQAEDLRILGGRVGASRPRVNVQAYNSLMYEDIDDIWNDSAIVIMGAEESKALGDGQDTTLEDPLDIGKNMWYYTFDLRSPEFVMQGAMLNQPAKCSPLDEIEDGCAPDEFWLVNDNTDYNTDLDVYGGAYDFYETEIARRFSHMTQPIDKIASSGVSAALIVKQGIINQGGPADIFLRLTKADPAELFSCDANGDGVIEEVCATEGYNPYAYENMVCENLDGTSGWVFLPGDEDDPREGTVEVNPRYIEGLCLSNMINVSGTTIDACDGVAGDCADAFPWEGGEGDYPKVTWWSQIGPNYGDTVDETNIGTLDDQSWYNPYDVAKGHRGFIDGDFIMMMYAWSPNWKANSVGNDHYQLYARRSFDGGKTWTTLPAEYLTSLGLPTDWAVVADGTYTCEYYKDGDVTTEDCTTYTEGQAEQARNLSKLIGNKITVLDPRYTPTGGPKKLPITDLKETGFEGYWDDLIRDPSKYFIVYETGDNTVVEDEAATPLNLYYSRATNFGDDYFEVEYPSGDGGGTTETYYAFDWLEHDHDDLSGEAANTCNNAGTFYYAIWNQWEEDEYGNVSESDAIFRRIWFEDDELTGLPAPSYIVGEISYVSTTQTGDLEDEITFIGTTRGQEAVEYLWTSDTHGELSREQAFTIKASDLGFGRHRISFMATTQEGLQSAPVDVDVTIGYFLHLPALNH